MIYLFICGCVCATGPDAKKVFDEAHVLLEHIMCEGLLTARGVVGLFPAHALNDDIIVYDEEGSQVQGTLYGLRQQVRLKCT